MLFIVGEHHGTMRELTTDQKQGLTAAQIQIVQHIEDEANRKSAIEKFLELNKVDDGLYWTPLEEWHARPRRHPMRAATRMFVCA